MGWDGMGGRRANQNVVDTGKVSADMARGMVQESHLTVSNAAEIIGKVQSDLSVKVLQATDFGSNLGEETLPCTLVSQFDSTHSLLPPFLHPFRHRPYRRPPPACQVSTHP